MKKGITAFLPLFIGWVASAQAQNEDSLLIRAIANDILTHGTAYENLRQLTKGIGGRLSGSPQAARAVQWGARLMKELGADTVYLQECQVPHWVRGAKEEARIISGRRDFIPPLHACALGNSVGTGTKGITAPVVEVHSFEELEQLGKKKVKGRIVFYNYPFNQTFIKTFYGYDDAVRFRVQGPSRAARLGAVGVVIRSVSTAYDQNPHTGTTHYEEGLPKIPAIALSTMDADLLSKRLQQDPGAQLYFKTHCRMLPDVRSYNVIGEIRGSEHPEEIITVGGHLDSWDLAEGAHDDGTGCVQSMEILRVFKALGIRPRRSFRAVLFMNEENGLRGGRKYAEIAQQRNEKHLLAIETDAGGFTPRGFSMDMPAEKKQKILAWKALFLPYGVYDFSETGSGADIGLLKPLGTALMELSPDSQRYFDYHHTPVDNFEKVNKRELELGAINLAAMVYLVSKYGL